NGSPGRPIHLGLRWRSPSLSPNVIARLWPCFDNSAALQQTIRLGDGSDADILLFAAAPDRWHAFTRPQRSVLDQFRDAQCDLFVEAVIAVQLCGGMSGQIL